MFTRCPNCNQLQELTVDQLRITRAILWCPSCAIHFDALEQLSDTHSEAPIAINQTEPLPVPTPERLLDLTRNGLLRRDRTKPKPRIFSERYRLDEADIPSGLPWEAAPQAGSPYWRYGVLAGLLLLAAQLLYFHGGAISQNRTLRRLCQTIGCTLPTYHNAEELAILNSVLEPLPDHGQLFKALIVNQATEEQAYPNINLTLLDYEGNALARRRFTPNDYLPGSELATIKPDGIAELTLHIAPTTQTVGGYTFDLTY